MKKILIPIILLLIILSLSFYWFAWRPAQIKHDCSWIKIVEAAVPAYPALTEDELRKQGIITACPTPLPTQIPTQNSTTGYYDKAFEERRIKIISENFFINICNEENIKTITKYSKPREAIPKKENWRKATDEEYKFCLRDKGL